MEIGWRKAVDAIIESGRQYEAISLLLISAMSESMTKSYKLERIARLNAAGAKEEEIDELCRTDEI